MKIGSPVGLPTNPNQYDNRRLQSLSDILGLCDVVCIQCVLLYQWLLLISDYLEPYYYTYWVALCGAYRRALAVPIPTLQWAYKYSYATETI